MIIIKPKLKIKTYQRPNGTNEFKDYLNTINPKEQHKFLEVLTKIEHKGQLVARKNQWLTNIRDTGLFEIRSSVARNQQRAIGYYDNDDQIYIILTGFTKKDERFNGDVIQYASQLKQEAIDNPHFVSYRMNVKPVKTNEHPIKKRKKHTTVNAEQEALNQIMEANEMAMKISNQNLEDHLHSLIPYQSLDQLAKSIGVKIIDINHFIFSPQIENVRKVCDIMKISVDDLFQYDARHTSYPVNPAWHMVKKYQQTEDDYILLKLSNAKIEISKIDKQIPIQTIFKLADKYQLTLNELFDYEPIEEPKATSSIETDNTTEADDVTNESVELKSTNKTKSILDNPVDNQYYNAQLTIQLMQNIILGAYHTMTEYNKDDHIDMTMNDIYNIKSNRTYAKLIPMANALQVSCQDLLSYQIPTDVYDFNTLPPVTKQGLLAYFAHRSNNPIMDYLTDHGYQSWIAKDQFLNTYGLTATAISKAYHAHGIINLLTFAQNFHVSIDNLINKQIIDKNGVNGIVTASYHQRNHDNDVKPTIGTPPASNQTKTPTDAELKTVETNVEQTNVKDDKPMETNDKAPVPETDQRLARMFEQIKTLTPNQILILNDLINSWQ